MPVFDRRSREREAAVRDDFQAGLRDFRLRIFDELRLVEHGEGKAFFRQKIRVRAQHAVARKPDVRRRSFAFFPSETAFRAERFRAQLREKIPDFVPPDGNDAGGADDERRPARRRVEREQRERLQCFAQAHFVGEQRMCAAPEHAAKPRDAARLIRAQKRGKPGNGLGLSQKIFPPRPQLRVGNERVRRLVAAEQREQRVNRDAVRGGIGPVVGDGFRSRAQAHDASPRQKNGFAAMPEQRARFGFGEAFPVERKIPDGAEGVPRFRTQTQTSVDFPRRAGKHADVFSAFDFEAALPAREKFVHETDRARRSRERVDAALRVEGKVGPARRGDEADELSALFRRELRVGRGDGQRGNAVAARAVFSPERGEGKFIFRGEKADGELAARTRRRGGNGCGGSYGARRSRAFFIVLFFGSRRKRKIRVFGGDEFLDDVERGDGERSGFAARRGRAAAPKDVSCGVQVEKNLQLRRRLRGNAEDDGGGIFFNDDFRDAQFAVEPASGEERVFREAFFPVRRRRGREAFAPESERFQGKGLPRRRRVGFAVHGVAVFLFSPFAGTRGRVFSLRADFSFSRRLLFSARLRRPRSARTMRGTTA